ncbi:MAG: hypothetical protein SWO11_22755 [Thermodesulfobacteriota bacterium]|nr:hypothetical protein [Thermodesulfobacteriota bacterium]
MFSLMGQVSKHGKRSRIVIIKVWFHTFVKVDIQNNRITCYVSIEVATEMRFTEFLIDLNDLWGRLIPGTLILFDLYMLNFSLMETTTLPKIITGSGALMMGFLFAIFAFIYLLGELSLYPIFRIRGWLCRPTPRENIKELDVTGNGNVVNFFEKNFLANALDDKKDDIFIYCKDFLLEASPRAYEEARRREARINLKGGVILPLLGLLIIALIQHDWILSLLAFCLFVVFWFGFARSFSIEHKFVYRAYYNKHLEMTDELHNQANAADAKSRAG